MEPILFFPEQDVQGCGSGPVIELGPAQGKPLHCSLTVNRITQQHILDISVWGSEDGADFGTQPIAVLPSKYYCGTYHHTLDLDTRPRMRFLRVDYRFTCWGHRVASPLCVFAMTAEPVSAAMLTAVP
jgi:hypothetical protein